MAHLYKLSILLMASTDKPKDDPTYRMTCTKLRARSTGKTYTLEQPFGLTGTKRVAKTKLGQIESILKNGLTHEAFRLGFSMWVDDEADLSEARTRLVSHVEDWMAHVRETWANVELAATVGNLDYVYRDQST